MLASYRAIPEKDKVEEKVIQVKTQRSCKFIVHLEGIY